MLNRIPAKAGNGFSKILRAEDFKQVESFSRQTVFGTIWAMMSASG